MRLSSSGQNQKRTSNGKAKAIATTIRFIAHQMKDLCMDRSGRLTRIEYVDNVFEDLCGVKAFSQRLNLSRNAGQFVSVVQQVGADVVLDILYDETMFEALHQLVSISERMKYLKKSLKKLEDKMAGYERVNPKRDKIRSKSKDCAHELKYLRKIYKDSILVMQSMLGIETGAEFGDYKERYQLLKSFIDKGGRRSFDDFDYMDGFDAIDDPIFFGGMDYASSRPRRYGRERRRGRNPMDELASFGTELNSAMNRMDDDGIDVDFDEDVSDDIPSGQDFADTLDHLTKTMDTMLSVMLKNGSFAGRVPESEDAPLIRDPKNATIGDVAEAFNNFGTSMDRRMTNVEDQVSNLSDVVVRVASSSIPGFGQEGEEGYSDPGTLKGPQEAIDALTDMGYTQSPDEEEDETIDLPEETPEYHARIPEIPDQKTPPPLKPSEAAKRDANSLVTSRAEVLSQETDFEKAQNSTKSFDGPTPAQ